MKTLMDSPDGRQQQPRPARAVAAVLPHDRGHNLPLATRHSPGVLAFGIGGYLGVLAMFWITFGGDGDAVGVLVVVSLFAVMYFGLPYVMTSTAARHDPRVDRPPSLSNFVNGDFDTLTGRVSGWSAFVQFAFLPIALAFGALALGITVMLLR